MDVRSFYEQMPYPAPLTSLDEQLAALKNSERRRIRSLLMFPAGPPRSRQRILVAGCGTSQAAKVAIREPESHVVAIDISDASLRHSRALQEKYHLENLEVHRLSILDVQSLDQNFDQIICTGVLHHLQNPDEGLLCLREVLNPDGAMNIMVYGAYGRVGIYMMQEYCRLLGIKPNLEELNSLGALLKHLPPAHPMAPLLRKVDDFQQPNALADALLHPQDRAYTVPQIYEWLSRCGMSFGRWLEQAPYLPQCGSIARTPHAAQISKLSDPEQYAAVELFRGATTQHTFIAYRSDRSKAAQPIVFIDEQWRKYIPVRLPWTKMVRDRIPTGAVGVILNPLHKYTDLFLPVDAAEDEMFSLIDGRRTLDEVARDFINKNGDERVRSFFEKLWQHDLIVLDASKASGANCMNGDPSYQNVLASKRDVTSRELFDEVLIP